MPDNAYIEAFNSRLRAECLNASWFLSMHDARDRIERWRREYNEDRPHTPTQPKLTKLTKPESSHRSRTTNGVRTKPIMH